MSEKFEFPSDWGKAAETIEEFLNLLPRWALAAEKMKQALFITAACRSFLEGSKVVIQELESQIGLKREELSGLSNAFDIKKLTEERELEQELAPLRKERSEVVISLAQLKEKIKSETTSLQNLLASMQTLQDARVAQFQQELSSLEAKISEASKKLEMIQGEHRLMEESARSVLRGGR